jgi:superfamily II DNA or RNA helicase
MRRYGCLRVMIADAVGLGKTIQAGLIIRELSSEHQSFRALVVTPAGLRDQWAAELATRFGIKVELVTSAWLARAVREVPSDVGPWALPGVYLCSFEYIRRPEVLRPLEDLTWDLLVVDEAHAATPRSDRRAAVHAVALRSRRVLLLTATPHGGDDEQFRALCDIGRSDERPDSLLIFGCHEPSGACIGSWSDTPRACARSLARSGMHMPGLPRSSCASGRCQARAHC